MELKKCGIDKINWKGFYSLFGLNALSKLNNFYV